MGAVPTDGTRPWDLKKVAHLHRRAGLRRDWAELHRDLKDGPDAAVDRLLDSRQRRRRCKKS